MAFNLKNPRPSRYGDGITANTAKISGVNFNENGSYRIDVDFYSNRAAVDNGDQPLDSEQYNEIVLTAGTINTIEAALKRDSNVDP